MSEPAAAEPERRVVALGASNLKLGLVPFVETAQAALGGAVDLLTAMGHGRSYGHKSRVMGRTLPGIIECGLWDALKQRPSLPTTALVTDVGNDLLYGDPPERVVRWVTGCVDRLLEAGAEVTLTELPLPSLTGVGPARYRLFRTIFFPACRMSLVEMSERAQRLNDALRALGDDRALRVVAFDSSWYGFDPIHLKRPSFPVAWQKIFASPQCDESCLKTAPLTYADRRSLHATRPDLMWRFGVEKRRSQPSVTLNSGVVSSAF